MYTFPRTKRRRPKKHMIVTLHISQPVTCARKSSCVAFFASPQLYSSRVSSGISPFTSTMADTFREACIVSGFVNGRCRQAPIFCFAGPRCLECAFPVGIWYHQVAEYVAPTRVLCASILLQIYSFLVLMEEGLLREHISCSQPPLEHLYV